MDVQNGIIITAKNYICAQSVIDEMFVLVVNLFCKNIFKLIFTDLIQRINVFNIILRFMS